MSWLAISMEVFGVLERLQDRLPLGPPSEVLIPPLDYTSGGYQARYPLTD
jgi:hypothetical protein